MPRHNSSESGSRRSRYSKTTTPIPMSSLNMIHATQHHPHNHPTMRTPVAWALRDANLSRPASALPYTSQYNTMSSSSHRYPPPLPGRHLHQNHHNNHHHHHHRRPSSPSATTTSSDDREEVPMVRTSRRPPSHMRGSSSDRRSVISRASRAHSQIPMQLVPQELIPFMHHHPAHFSGTLRSTRSVPALAMASAMDNGCPVHGLHGPPPSGYPMPQPLYHPAPHELPPLRRVGSLVDMRSLPPNSFTLVNYMPEGKKGPFGGLPLPPPPPVMFSPRPLMIPNGINPANHHQFKSGGGSTKITMRPEYLDEGTVCCKGHLIVLWIILAVVTLGVISGIVLGVTMN